MFEKKFPVQKAILILFLSMFFPQKNFAQNISDRVTKMESLGTRDGLSQGMINCIYQDRMGFMWFGTLDGLNRYDGYHFTVFRFSSYDSSSISGNFITCIFEDSKNRLWVGTALNGINLFDRATETFTRFQHSSTNANTLSENRILSVQEDKTGTIWVGTMNGLNKLRIKEKQPGNTALKKLRLNNFYETHDVSITKVSLDETNPSNELFKLYEPFNNTPFEPNFFIDRKGTVWISVLNAIYRIIPSLNGKDSVLRSGNNEFIEKNKTVETFNDRVLNFEEDTASGFLYLRRAHSITALAPNNGALSTFNFSDLTIGTPRSKIAFSSGKILMVNSHRLYEHDLVNKKIVRLVTKDPEQNLRLGSVSTLYKDRSGMIWIGTAGYGLLKYNPLIDQFHATNTEGISWMRATSDNDVMIQTTKLLLLRADPGADRYYSDTFFFKRITEWFPSSTATLPVQTKDKNYVINIFNDIIEFDPGNNAYKKTVNDLPAFPFFVDLDDNLWFGSNTAFCKLDRKTNVIQEFKYPLPRISSSPYAFLEAVHQDANRIFWLGTVNGLLRFDEKKISWKQYLNIPNNAASLSADMVFSICDDPRHPEKYLWVGTNGGGLNLFEKETGNCKRFMEKDGLSNNVVYGILSDAKGNLWMSTNKGLSRFTPSSAPGGQGIFKNFLEEDGLQSNEFNRNAYAKTKNGLLFFGGVNGYNYLDPGKFRESDFIPDVMITDFKINNRSVPFSGKRPGEITLEKPIFLTDQISLPFSVKMISFDFTSTDFTNPGRNVFLFKMDDIDKEWINSGSNHYAIYTNLDPGNYTFSVKTLSGNGKWNGKITSVKIYILPPWYMTWWFRLSGIFAVAFILYVLYRYRLKQSVKLQEVRNRIADDLHDEIGSTLSSVHIYSEVALQSIKDKAPEANNYLNQISIDTSSMIEALSDIVWTVNSKNDRFANIITRLRVSAIELFEANHMDLHLQIDEGLNNLKLGMADRKNFYLFYKEAINNVAKYAYGKNVWIDLQYRNHIISLSVKDDGKGFDLLSGTGGNGLTTMKKRATELKGEFEINSVVGSGTEVKLLFPYR